MWSFNLISSVVLLKVTSFWSSHALPDLFYCYGLKSLSSVISCSYLVFCIVSPSLPILFCTYLYPLSSFIIRMITWL